MKSLWLLQAAEAFGVALKRDFSASEFRRKAIDFEQPGADDSVGGFFLRLLDLGRRMDLSFFESEVSSAEFAALLDDQLLPMLVYSGEGGEFRTYVVSEYRNGEVTLTPLGYTSNPSEAVVRRRLSDLRPHLLSRAQSEVARRGERLGDITADDQIYVVTALFVQPLVTPEEVRSGEVTVLTPLARVWHLFASEKADISFIYIYAVAVGLVGLTLPVGVQAITGLISGGLILEPVVILVGGVILGTIITGALQVMQMQIVENLQQRVFARASFELALRIPRMNMEALRGSYPPELLNRFFDVLNIQKGFAKVLLDLITAVLQMAFGLVLLMFYHPYFIFFSVIIISVLAIIFRLTGERGLKTSLDESKYKYKTAHWLQEIARNMATFKLANDSRMAVEKTDYLVSNYLQKRQKHFKVLIVQYGAVLAFKVLVVGGLLILGSVLVIGRQISLGQFVASELIIITILGAVEKVILSLDVIYDLLTATEKVGQVTDIPLERERGQQMVPGDVHHGFAITARDVKYRYAETNSYSLKGVSFKIESGQRVGILGEAGSGTTTLLNVLMGFYTSYEGVLLYNGISTRDLNAQSIQTSIGKLTPDESIFDGTLAENLSLGRYHISFERVMAVLDRVGLREWVERQPEGINTHLVAGGGGLPLHVRERMLLARCIIDSPRLVVLDRLFAQVTGTFRNHAVDMLFDRTRPWTVLIVSHEADILRACDQVLVLRDGVVYAQGHYDELLRDPNVASLVPNLSVSPAN
jgi:ABC-type bacteriocin/lantibiotic exporter with double-glycine peptidase domain